MVGSLTGFVVTKQNMPPVLRELADAVYLRQAHMHTHIGT
jgi:hypothetical protein